MLSNGYWFFYAVTIFIGLGTGIDYGKRGVKDLSWSSLLIKPGLGFTILVLFIFWGHTISEFITSFWGTIAVTLIISFYIGIWLGLWRLKYRWQGKKLKSQARKK